MSWEFVSWGVFSWVVLSQGVLSCGVLSGSLGRACGRRSFMTGYFVFAFYGPFLLSLSMNVAGSELLHFFNSWLFWPLAFSSSDVLFVYCSLVMPSVRSIYTMRYLVVYFLIILGSLFTVTFGIHCGLFPIVIGVVIRLAALEIFFNQQSKDFARKTFCWTMLSVQALSPFVIFLTAPSNESVLVTFLTYLKKPLNRSIAFFCFCWRVQCSNRLFEDKVTKVANFYGPTVM